MNYKELKEYFSDKNNIKDNVNITDWETVGNGKFFIESTIATLNKNSGNKFFIPYYTRLVLYYNAVK